MAPPYSAVSFSPWSLPARTLQINKSAETLHNCSFKVNFIVLYLAYVLFFYMRKIRLRINSHIITQSYKRDCSEEDL